VEEALEPVEAVEGGRIAFVRLTASVAGAPLTLIAWSGSAAASALKPAVPGLLRVSPLLAGGRALRGSPGRPLVLELGEAVELEYAASPPSLPQALPPAPLRLASSQLEPVDADMIVVDSVDALRMLAPRIPPGSEEFRVRFHPTMFMFRGRRVLYPSPARLLMGAARNLYEATGLDLRGHAAALARAVELTGWQGGIVKVSIGKGRVVKAFEGIATYTVDPDSLPPGWEEILSLLLAAARLLGAGRSRGIGFGHVEPLSPKDESLPRT